MGIAMTGSGPYPWPGPRLSLCITWYSRTTRGACSLCKKTIKLQSEHSSDGSKYRAEGSQAANRQA